MTPTPTFPSDIEKLKPRIDALVAPTLKAGCFPGMVVGILDGGEVRVFGYGKTSMDNDRVPDGNTEYEIGSITKLFTELLLLDMVRRGEMGLEDPAQKYFPKGVKAPALGGKTFTLRQLAKHTSGLPRNPDNENMMEPNVWGDYTLSDLYGYLSRCPLESEPGGKFLYSNTGYGLLGDLIGAKDGRSYEAYLKKLVLDPAGMKNTGVRWSEDQLKRASGGMDGDDQPAALWKWNQTALAGAAGLHSTAGDLLKLAQAVLDPARSPLSHIAFSPTAAQLDWGDFVQHDGGTDGFASSFTVDRNQKKAVVLLADCNNFILFKLSHKIQALLLEGTPPGSLKMSKTIKGSLSRLRPYAGKYRVTAVNEVLRLRKGDVLNLAVEQGHLVANMEGNCRRFMICLESGDRFFVKSLDTPVVFVKDKKGRVLRVRSSRRKSSFSFSAYKLNGIGKSGKQE